MNRLFRQTVALALLAVLGPACGKNDEKDFVQTTFIIGTGGLGGFSTPPPPPAPPRPDTWRPVLEMGTHPSIVATDTLNLTGRTYDDEAVTEVTWTQGPLSGKAELSPLSYPWYSLSATIPLSPGANTILVTARDAAGNATTSSVDVVRDASPPIVVIETPTTAPSWSTASGSVTIGGTSSDNLGLVALSWSNRTNGMNGSVTGLESWTASVPLVQGENLVEVKATDVAGSQATDSVLIAVDAPVVAWCANAGVVLGNPAFPQGSTLPVPVSIDSAVQVVCGGGFSLALKANGTVVAWGDNQYGQLGNPSVPTPGIPVTVDLPSEVTAVDAGILNGIALTREGTVWIWGWGWYAFPAVVPGVSGVRAIAAGGLHSLALLEDGTVREWETSTSAVRNPGLIRIIAISAGLEHSVAMDADGVVWIWGSRGFSNPVMSTIPVVLAQFADAIAIGRGATTMIRSGGRVSAWTVQTAPVEVPGLSEVVSTDTFWPNNFLAVKSNGTLWSWDRTGTAAPLNALTGVVAASMGNGFGAARRR